MPTHADRSVEAFLEKTDGRGPDQPHQRRRLRARARGGRDARPGRPRRARSSARSFPQLVGDGLYGWAADGYWIDIGTPERYLESTYDLLAGAVDSTLPPRDETGSLIGDGCLTAGAHIGPQTVLGAHCSVGSDSSVERSALHDRVSVGADCVVREAVLAERVQVGDGARIEPGAMVGAGARVEAGAVVPGDARVEPDAVVEAGEAVG